MKKRREAKTLIAQAKEFQRKWLEQGKLFAREQEDFRARFQAILARIEELSRR